MTTQTPAKPVHSHSHSGATVMVFNVAEFTSNSETESYTTSMNISTTAGSDSPVQRYSAIQINLTLSLTESS